MMPFLLEGEPSHSVAEWEGSGHQTAGTSETPVILNRRRRARVVWLPKVVMNDTRASRALAVAVPEPPPSVTDPDRLLVNFDCLKLRSVWMVRPTYLELSP